MPLSCTQTGSAARVPAARAARGQFQRWTSSCRPSGTCRSATTTHSADPTPASSTTTPTVLDNARWDANVNGEMWVRAEARARRQAAHPRGPHPGRAAAGHPARGAVRRRLLPDGQQQPEQGDHREPRAGRRPLRRRPRRTTTCIKYVERADLPGQQGRVQPRPRLRRSATAWREALKQTAIAKKTYYATCADIPAQPDRRGRLGRERQVHVPGQHDRQRHDQARRVRPQQRHARPPRRRAVVGDDLPLNTQNCGSVDRRLDPASAPTASPTSPARRRSSAGSSSRAPAG